MATTISSAQLTQALTFAGELADLDEFAQVSQRVPQLLRDLIACDHSGHNVINIAIGNSIVVTDPPDAVFSGGEELLGQYAQQSPLVVEAKRGNCDPLRLSDYISAADLHRTDLYNCVYKIVGMEHQLVMQLPPLFDCMDSSQQVVGISLARSTRDFTDSEVLLLDAIRPILTSTLQRLHYLALIHAVVDQARDGEAVILFDTDRIVTWVTPSAQQRLGVSPGSRIPAALQTHVGDVASWRQPPNQDFATALLGDQSVRVRLVANAYPGLGALYVEGERQPGRTVLMRQLGVTARQADVMLLLMRGLTTVEVANQLDISRRTVESHLDGIYRRLGVRNRGEAILAAIHHNDH